MIGKASVQDSNAKVPQQLKKYCQKGWDLGACEDISLDKLVRSAARRTGMPMESVSNHVLRRTRARTVFYSGVNRNKVESEPRGFVGTDQPDIVR